MLNDGERFCGVVCAICIVKDGSRFLRFLAVGEDIVVRALRDLFRAGTLSFAGTFTVRTFSTFVPGRILHYVAVVGNYCRCDYGMGGGVLFVSGVLPGVTTSGGEG